MRLIFGFIFFGLLFYAIYLYFPETFQTLVGWAAKIFDFIKEGIDKISGKFSNSPPADQPEHAAPAKTLALFYLSWL